MPQDVGSLQKSLSIYRGLVEVSALINSITDFDELLRAILKVARRVMNAELASLFLIKPETGELELVIASTVDGQFEKPQIIVPKGKGIAGWVAETGESLLIEDAYQDPRFYAEADRDTGFRTRSLLAAPLAWEGNKIGVIEVINPVEKAVFEAEDLDGFQAYATLIATAIEKLRTLERMRKQERMDRDLSIAAEIQRETLSRSIPAELPGTEFACHNEPAATVGGDFFTVSVRSPDEIYFAIGDVSGKGISAALLMAQTLSAMEFVFNSSTSPANALARLNDTLQARIVRGMFVTTLIGRMTPSSRHVELASAGHCPPLLVHPDGTASKIEVIPALPLGVLPGTRYAQGTVRLNQGEALVAYTDGLSESQPPESKTFFDEVLLQRASGPFQSPGELIHRLADAERAHRGNQNQRDDLTILATRFRDP